MNERNETHINAQSKGNEREGQRHRELETQNDRINTDRGG